MAIVVTVRQGTSYGVDYVEMLGRMVARQGFNLVTLTDQDDTPGDTLPLRLGYRGWWSKLELFRPDLEAHRPFLFFDLDTYILGDISPLVEDAEDLWLLRDFYRENRSNSGVMRIPKNTESIWKNHFRWQTKVDGDFLNTQKHRVIQDEFPLYSYKIHCKHGPRGAVTCFHGKPKPHEAEGWAKEVWHEYTN